MRTRRHNDVNSGFCSEVRPMGAIVREEPRTVKDDAKELRPDAKISIASSRIFTDITIINPLAVSNVGQAAKKPLALAVAAESEKIAKYQEFARVQRHQFFPVALETTGGMGKKCVELISLLITEGKNTL